MIFEFNHSLLAYGAIIGELVNKTVIFPEDMKSDDLWNEVLATNPIIYSSTIGSGCIMVSYSK